jgi:hypothetical protein
MSLTPKKRCILVMFGQFVFSRCIERVEIMGNLGFLAFLAIGELKIVKIRAGLDGFMVE